MLNGFKEGTERVQAGFLVGHHTHLVTGGGDAGFAAGSDVNRLRALWRVDGEPVIPGMQVEFEFVLGVEMSQRNTVAIKIAAVCPAIVPADDTDFAGRGQILRLKWRWIENEISGHVGRRIVHRTPALKTFRREAEPYRRAHNRARCL